MPSPKPISFISRTVVKACYVLYLIYKPWKTGNKLANVQLKRKGEYGTFYSYMLHSVENQEVIFGKK